MDNQQRTAFDQWFDSELDPELNLTPGDKELCRHAWQAALSHAEGEVVDLDRYDAGFLGSNGGGDVGWWHDYIRAVLEDAHDFYLRQVDGLARPAPQVAEGCRDELYLFWDAQAYASMRDEIEYWKRRAQESDDALERIREDLSPTHMGEPVLPDDLLTMLVRRLAHALRKAAPDNDLAEKAMDYLRRKRPTALAWREATAEQPVSDPDGLTEPGRREAEQAYINCAFDYARDPIGSRDWFLFWNGWRARNAAPAPDEREIAARALDEFRTGPLRSACLSYGWDTESDAYIVDRMLDEEAARIRAGKEGEQS